MFFLLFSILILLTVAGLIIVYKRCYRSDIVQRLSKDRRWLRRLLSLIPVLLFIICFLFDAVITIICTLHLMIFWIISDMISWIIKKIVHRTAKSHFYWTGLAALLMTVIYLGIGWYYGHHVYETDYSLQTTKELGTTKNETNDSLRIALIADSHIGSTFDGEGFAEHIRNIENTRPDMLVITGDYVDDETKKSDLISACRALGQIKTTYGVFYVFGNHDKGYYNRRDFNEKELRNELLKNNVRILEDESVMINDFVYVIGRKDRGEDVRKTASELMQGVDSSKYTIMLDHQPNDYKEEKKSGADLVLSGHTHGGQMFPIGITGEISGANNMTYGHKRYGATDFIVTSGISDWAIPFKTATIAEYVIIDVRSSN